MSWKKGQPVRFVKYVGSDEIQALAKDIWAFTPGKLYAVDDFLTAGNIPHVTSDNDIGAFEADGLFEFELVNL